MQAGIPVATRKLENLVLTPFHGNHGRPGFRPHRRIIEGDLVLERVRAVAGEPFGDPCILPSWTRRFLRRVPQPTGRPQRRAASRPDEARNRRVILPSIALSLFFIFPNQLPRDEPRFAGHRLPVRPVPRAFPGAFVLLRAMSGENTHWPSTVRGGIQGVAVIVVDPRRRRPLPRKVALLAIDGRGQGRNKGCESSEGHHETAAHRTVPTQLWSSRLYQQKVM